MMRNAGDGGREAGRLGLGGRNRQELSLTAQDRCERVPHRSDRADRPDLIEHKPHDHQGETDSDQPVTCGREFRGSARRSERYGEKGERDLKADISESTTSSTPRGNERDNGNEPAERSNGIHVRKEENDRAQTQQNSTENSPGQPVRQLLFHGSCRGEAGNQHCRNRGGDFGIVQRMIEDVTKRRAEAYFQTERQRTFGGQRPRNKERNSARGENA